MPNAPDKRDKHDAFEVPQRKSCANHYEENRCENESVSETLKQGAVTVGANHAWQVVPHRTERSDKKINVFGGPDPLGPDKDGHQQERRTDVKNQVAPTVQNPQIRLASSGCRTRHSRDSLRRGEGRTVLHALAEPSLPQTAAKINPL